jgi:signal transduction histidine kinase
MGTIRTSLFHVLPTGLQGVTTRYSALRITLGQGWKPKQEVLGAITDCQVAGLRLFLSLTAFTAIAIDPPENDPFNVASPALLIYSLYSATIYVIARGRESFSRNLNAILVWTDVVLFSALIWLSNGTGSIFFFFYFFAILIACSRLGSRAGWMVMLAAVAAFLSLALLGSPDGVEWNRVFVRSVSLFVLGYVLAYWAAAEETLRRKLDLLREVSLTSNPRFGVNRTASHVMRRVLEFFEADSCVLLEYGEGDEYSLRTANVRNPDAGADVVPLPPKVRDLLQSVVPDGVALYTSQSWWQPSAFVGWDPDVHGAATELNFENAAQLSEWLDSGCFISVPLRHHEWVRGYLFVGSRRGNSFRIEDARFLLQLADQVTPVLEHIRLVDRMASGAAEDERRRIARSVHDRIIQPYIGLQIGLRGLRQVVRSALKAGGTNITVARSQHAMASIDYLVEMAREGVEELREYVSDLRKSGDQGDVLLNSLLRYAAKFEAVTGIRVSVVSALDGGALNDRLVGEIFQMAAEALSNVHRHTTATAVHLSVERHGPGSIVVRIANKASEHEIPPGFIPKSISERAESLGGYTQVTQSPGHTVVNIEIPL